MSGAPKAILALAALAAGLVFAGCGEDDLADSGPPSVTPESAPVYVDVSVRPEGEARDDAEAALGRILGTEDPGQRVIELAEQQAAQEGDEFDYEQDVEPWLGERFAIFLTTIGGDTTDSQGGFVFETTDVETALEFLRSAPDSTGRTEEHEGVEFEFDTDGDVFGAVGDFIVGGDEAAFKAAVDAHDGDSLGDSDEFDDAVEELSEDRLSTLYVPPEQFLEAVSDQELDPQARDFLKRALGEAGDQPILGEVTASAESVTIELSAGGSVETSESGLLAELPGDAWFAVGFADVGAAVQGGLQQVEQARIPGLDGAAIREQLRNQSGINLEQDVIATLGDAALFVQGTSVNSVGGALVVESKNPETSAQLLTKLQDLISREAPPQVKVQPIASATGDQGFQISGRAAGLQQPISVIQRQNRIIAGYGRAAVNQALGSDGGAAQPLSGSPAFKGAQDAVGELGIDALLSFAPAIQLTEAAGAGADPDYKQAKPYLDSLDFLALGSGNDDDRSQLRFVVGLE